MIKPINNPELTVGIDDNFQNLMEEYGDFVWLIFILGIILGIIISLIFYQIYDFLRDRKPEEDFTIKANETQNSNIQKSEMENSNSSDNCAETTIRKDETKKEEKDMTFFVIIFLLVSFLIVAIVISCAINNSTDNNFNEQTSQIRNATLDDIYTKITTISNDNRTITIQASEKIKGLVIEVRFIDKNAVVLKTQRIDVGNISPGNEFTYKLTLDGMKISDIDRVNSFTIRMVKGTIEE